MKVIDLLNKIANGEEVPKRIKYENRILYLEDEAEDYEPTFNYYDKDGEYALFEGWIGQYLNDEVEIIEEDNKDNFTGWKMYQDGKEVRSIEVRSIGCSTNEEKKIPEKINVKLGLNDENKVNDYTATNLECDLALIINEIIDYLEEIE